MLLKTILTSNNKSNPYIDIRNECSEFVSLSEGLPVFKNLSKTYDDVQRVKVRHRKTTDKISKTFNEAFEETLPKLSQRAIFANGVSSFAPSSNHDTFYIFPTNGFKFLYSIEVENSSLDYKAVFDSVLETFNGDIEKTTAMVAEVIRYTYTNEHLNEGIENGSEIIFLDVPYYYAVRCSTIDYEELLSLL